VQYKACFIYHISMKEINNNFGKRLKEERNRLGLTQLELAKKIGVTSKTISNYETGMFHTPLMYMIKEGIDIGYLITGHPLSPECLEQLILAIVDNEPPEVNRNLVIDIIKQQLEYLR